VKRLTEKEKLFVKYYPQMKFNAVKAYIKAGYSKNGARQSAYKLLTYSYIQKAIEKVTKRIMEKADLTQDMVIEELRKIAFSDIKEFMDIGPKGIKIKDLKDIDTSVISSADMRVSKFGLHVGIKLHKKVDALELLGKHFGAFNESNKFQLDLKNLKVTFANIDFEKKGENDG
jgi:phage terminase small subunit